MIGSSGGETEKLWRSVPLLGCALLCTCWGMLSQCWVTARSPASSSPHLLRSLSCVWRQEGYTLSSHMGSGTGTRNIYFHDFGAVKGLFWLLVAVEGGWRTPGL